MSIKPHEIQRLKQLLHEEEIFQLINGLSIFNKNTSLNYKLLYNAINNQEFDSKGELINGYSGVILEGSSRSGKTWSWIFIVIYLGLIKHKGEAVKINVYREHYADFKKTLFDDFTRILDLFDLPNKFHNAERVDSFRIGKTTVHLLGCDKLKGSGHGSGSDYAIFNEMMYIDKKTYLQAVKRCRKFWVGDYNPSFTDHWVFDMVIPRKDVGFLRTTFKDNPFISPKEKIEILITEPYLPDSYQVTEDDIVYNGMPVTEKNQPPPHPVNAEQGTADEFEWRVYGLGLRGAMKGVIYPQMEWIEEFPSMDYIYANDFGFTCFSGDTLIETNKGSVKIKDIKKGNLVLTREGYKKVLKNFDNGIKKVVNKRFAHDFGYTEISATLNHNFNANNKWKKFGELQEADTLCTILNTTEKYIQDIQKESIKTIISENGWRTILVMMKGYIMLFINFIKEVFLKTKLFIILTLIRLITILSTYLQSLIVNMQKYTTNACMTTIIVEKVLRIGKIMDIIKIIGIKEEKAFLKNLKQKLDIAKRVTINSLQQIHIKNTVIKNAITNGSTQLKSMTWNWNAFRVKINLWETSIGNQKHVAKNVTINYLQIQELKTIKENYYERVYDLHIEDVHEYFANGILVHNCDPNALIKYTEDANNIYFELLAYQPIDNVPELVATFEAFGVEKEKQIVCDSSDKYSNHKGSVEMVSGLNDNGYSEAFKVRKTKDIMFWIGSCKTKKLHCVKDKAGLWRKVKKERENYIFKEINGKSINKPIDGHDHALTAMRYGHMSFNEKSYDLIW